MFSLFQKANVKDLNTAGLLKYTPNQGGSGPLEIAAPDVDYATPQGIEALVAEAQNASHHAQEAASEAQAALNQTLASAANASHSETNSAHSASNASLSESNAAHSETNASQFAAEALSASEAVAGVSSASFLLKEPNSALPNAQALSLLPSGLLMTSQNTPGVVQTAEPDVDYASAHSVEALNEQIGQLTGQIQETSTKIQDLSTQVQNEEAEIALLEAEVSQMAEDLSTTRGGFFLVRQASPFFPNAQDLSQLGEGMAKIKQDGSLELAVPGTDYLTPRQVIGDLNVQGTTISAPSGQQLILSASKAPGDPTSGEIVLGGTCIQKGIKDGSFTGSHLIKGQVGAQTVGAVSRSLLSLAIPTTAGSPSTALVCKAHVLAVAVNGSVKGACSFDMGLAGAYFDGVNSPISLGGFPVPGVRKSIAGFNVNASWGIVGSNLVININGFTGETVNWICSYEYYFAPITTN